MFWLFSAGFGVAAIFHLAALIDPTLGEPSPPWRHLLFAAINVAAAVGMARRPRGFVFAFAALLAQQVYSHGTVLISTWRSEHRVDWASVVVLVAMPAVFALLVRDARVRRRARGDHEDGSPQARERRR
jgi:hypothetical protein